MEIVLKRPSSKQSVFKVVKQSLLYQDLHAMCFRLSGMQNLTFVKLVKCNITHLPPEFGMLPLKHLVLDANLLYLSPDWCWLNGNRLINSLRFLSLAYNKLTDFPQELVKFENLETLILKYNKIRNLPFAMRRMRSLKLLSMSYNKLTSLPSSCYQLNLHSFHYKGNIFLPKKNHNLTRMLQMYTIGNLDGFNPFNNSTTAVPPLWLIAARVICSNNLPFSYETVPPHLVDFMLELPMCDCRKICYDSIIYDRAINTNIRNITLDSVLCSLRCSGIRRMI